MSNNWDNEQEVSDNTDMRFNFLLGMGTILLGSILPKIVLIALIAITLIYINKEDK